jgi:hypothetical protein
MVEKPKKSPPCDATHGKNREFWGDRLAEPIRDASVINNLRAKQPPPILETIWNDLKNRGKIVVTCPRHDAGLAG